MKVLAIIDSFKGTITSKELGKITKEQLAKRFIACDFFSISDGGDGFLECIEPLIAAIKVKCQIYDPLFREIETYYLKDANDCAYIEMALASGINLLQTNELNPYQTSTYGTGQLIKKALANGAKKIVVGIGGSATNDGGAGMLEALGVKFFRGSEMLTKMNCQKLDLITDIDITDFLWMISGKEIVILNDVKNPLLGINGATYVFSPQKGSRTEDLVIIEAKMQHYARICLQIFGVDNSCFPGAGAAGGLGFAFKTFFKAAFHQGINYILDLMDFDNLITDYDYIITGEGKIDQQSLFGKVVFAITKRALDKKVIVVCAVNELTDKQIADSKITKVYSIVPSLATAKESLHSPQKYYSLLCDNINVK